MPEVQYYQVTDELLLFQLDTHVEKTGKCYLTYTMSFTPETTSETLVLFDATERLFTFYEVEDLTVASIESPYHVNYTVTVSADQAEVATVTQSFILNVTNPCANSSVSTIDAVGDLDYYYVIGGDDALVIDIAEFGFVPTLAICEASELQYDVTVDSSPLSYDADNL